MSGTKAEQAAWDELDRLTAGSPGRLWRWSIPADPERDSDLILAAGLKAIAAERDAAHAVIAEARNQVRAGISERALMRILEAAK